MSYNPVFSCCLWSHGVSGAAWGRAAPSAAARPRAVRAASLRLGASSRSPVRPRRPINFARNSPAACSNIEFVSLELQRFWGVSKNDRDKSRATFGCRWCRLCPWAPQSGPLLPVGVMGGVLRVEFLGCSGACCYKRRQSKVFFVWLSAPLLRTSSIRGLFR